MTDEQVPDIQPCPWCKYEQPRINFNDHVEYPFVQCGCGGDDGCGACGPYGQDSDGVEGIRKAIEAWNVGSQRAGEGSFDARCMIVLPAAKFKTIQFDCGGEHYLGWVRTVDPAEVAVEDSDPRV